MVNRGRGRLYIIEFDCIREGAITKKQGLTPSLAANFRGRKVNANVQKHKDPL